MRASRLVSLLLLLQTRGRMTAQDLADELGVSVRTIYRDVESLSLAGVPVYADRGPTGGFQLLAGYRTRLTGLTPTEAESLFLAGIPGPAAELGLGTVLAAAELKLLAALPEPLRPQVGRVRERFHLDAPGWFQDVGETPYLGEVAEAVWNQWPLRVHHQRAGRGGHVHRMLEPLGVVLKAGAWYLVARVRPAKEGEPSPSETAHPIRTYRVSRILALETLRDETFEWPEGFDLAEFWHTWSRGFESGVYRGEASIRLSPRGVERMVYLLNPATSHAATETATPPEADGWLRATVPIESVEHALSELLRLGADVEVVSPPELRARMAEESAALAELYCSP